MAKKKKTTKSKPKTKKVSKVKKAKKVASPKKKAKNKVIVLPTVVDEVEIVEVDVEKKPDSYEEHGCEFVNESECEEELEDDGLDLEGVEKDHFNKEDEE